MTCAGVGYTECLPDGSGVDLDETALLLPEYESMEQVARELAGQVTRWEISTLEGRVLPLDEWPAYRALQGDFVRNLTLHYRSLVTGREWDCELNSAPILDDDGTVVRIVHTVRDVTEREATERERRDLELELRRLASTDPLTGVANRRAFLDRAQSEVNRAIRSGRALTLAGLRRRCDPGRVTPHPR